MLSTGLIFFLCVSANNLLNFSKLLLLLQNQNQGNSSATAITVFVGNITERASDALVRQILTVCPEAFVPLFISIHLHVVKYSKEFFCMCIL